MKTIPSDAATPTFARARVEIIIGRIFSSAALATSIETLVNGLGQTNVVSPIFLFGGIGLIIAAQLFAAVNFWLKLGFEYVYVWHGLAYALAFFLYPYSLQSGVDLAADYRPWIWWATGTANMAIGMYLPRWWAIGYLTFVPTSWVILRVGETGGAASIGMAIMDGLYIVLFSAAVLTLIGMVRNSAYRVDMANGIDLELARDRAAVEAAERERQRVDDLIHDQVLTTLVLAAKAEDREHQKLAAASADRAIERLEEATRAGEESQVNLAGGDLAESLERAILRLAPMFECKVSVTGSLEIPFNVGVALTDATLQAVQNSVQHAGKNAKRYARIKVEPKRIKVVIVDTGKGFHPSRVPANRLGISNSIRRRMLQVGGEKPNINSAPRKGTTIVLVWRLRNV